VIEQFDPHQLATPGEAACELNVLLARFWMARRVVVHKIDIAGAVDDHRVEDLAGVNDRGIKRAD
jgi:hypothetical protein